MCVFSIDSQRQVQSRITCGVAEWDQTFLFLLEQDKINTLDIECFEIEYKEKTFLGSCVLNNLTRYSDGAVEVVKCECEELVFRD